MVTFKALSLCNLSTCEKLQLVYIFFYLLSRAVEIIISGLGVFLRSTALGSLDGQRTILYCFLVPSPIKLCVLLFLF